MRLRSLSLSSPHARQSCSADCGRNGIDALDFWSIPHSSLPSGFPRAAELRRSIVGLPVHQELRRSDLERIVRTVRGRTSRRSELRIERLSSLESVREDWSRLAETTDNIFATWEWNSIWWRHQGGDRALCLLTDAVTGTEPLWRSCLCTSPSTGRSDSSASSGTVTPTISRRSAGRVSEALRLVLSAARLREGGVDLFVGENVPAAEGGLHFSGERCCVAPGSPVLRFRGEDWESVLARASHNTRGQVRRRERKLKREHDVRFRLAVDRERLDDDLDTLFALHRARWRAVRRVSARRPGSPSRIRARSLRSRVASALDPRSRRVRRSSAWYGFRFGRAESLLPSGTRPSLGSLLGGFRAPGSHNARSARRRGARVSVSGRGDEHVQVSVHRRRPRTGTVGVARGAARCCCPGHDLLRAATRGCWPLHRLSLLQPPSDQRSR